MKNAPGRVASLLATTLSCAALAAPTIDGCPVMPANNIWNARVDRLPLHPKSATYVNSIGPTRGFHMDFGSGVYPDLPDPESGPIGIPYITVPGTQPGVPITFEYDDESDPGPYPIPANAPIEGVGPTTPDPLKGGDRHVLVVDRDNCVLYETFDTWPPGTRGPTWEAGSGARWPLDSNMLRPSTWTSADAAGLPILPGLARYEEAISPQGIQHALRFTASQTQNKFIWPATHQAGSANVNRPPMGLRLRLKASYDIDGFGAQAKAIAQAMKTYGILLADNGSNWYVSGSPNEGWDNDQLHELDVLRGSDFEAVDTSSLMVSATSGQVAPRPSATTLTSSVNPSASAQSVTFTATLTGQDGPITGSVTFTNGGTPISGCNPSPVAAGVATCVTSALAAGVRAIAAAYGGDAVYAGSGSVALNQVVRSGAPPLSANPATLAFGGQSMNTTSPAQSTTITNNSGAAVTITSITPPPGYAVSSGCGALAAGASCTASFTFTPTTAGSFGNLAIVAHAGTGPTTIALTGTGERSLVSHYYRAILRRAPDAGGKAFWESEATRVFGIGANLNETWNAMAQQFFSSAEYLAFNRDNTGFVTDLYNTFFNRAPDGAGLSFWKGQLDSGLPREVAIPAFLFSAEFSAFTQAIFGNTTVRAELDSVTDFYRGLLSRTPDDGGFQFWIGRFQAAQCLNAGAVTAEAEAISKAYAESAEYLNRNRSNAQYVGDLYNAFLRRGGDLAGVQFWIDELATGARTRDNVRIAFRDSPEFQARVNAVIAAGCL